MKDSGRGFSSLELRIARPSNFIISEKSRSCPTQLSSCILCITEAYNIQQRLSEVVQHCGE